MMKTKGIVVEEYELTPAEQDGDYKAEKDKEWCSEQSLTIRSKWMMIKKQRLLKMCSKLHKNRSFSLCVFQLL